MNLSHFFLTRSIRTQNPPSSFLLVSVLEFGYVLRLFFLSELEVSTSFDGLLTLTLAQENLVHSYRK